MSAPRPAAVRRAAPVLRSRYLAALGITEWTQRTSVADPGARPEAAAAGSAPEVPVAEVPVAEVPVAEVPVAEVPVAEAPPELRATERPPAEPAGTTGSGTTRSLRALVDDDPAPVPGPVDAAFTEAAAGPDRAGAGESTVPRFRLTMLELEGGLLIVDDALLEPLADRRRALAPLGDLLRAAHLLQGRSVATKVGTRLFHWPQVEGDAVDQRLPRAVEALQAYAQLRTGTAGFVLRVGPSAGADPAVRAVLAALDEAGRPCVPLDAALLERGDGAARRAAWTALRVLEPGP